jgi:phenylalanyl-tRNA synthetase alpha subunit
MARLPLDTLRLAKRLEEAGFPPAQAEAQIQVLIELLTMQEAATKTDIQKLRLRIKRDLRLTEAQLRKEIQQLEAQLRKEIQQLETQLRKEIQETEARLRTEIEKVQLQMKEMEARLRAEIYRSHNRIIFWVAALIAAQIPIFYLLKRLLP